LKTRKIALTEGITAGLLFGTAAIFIRFLGGLEVFSIAFWRLIIACIVLTIILLVNGELSSLRLMRNSLLRLSVLGVFLGFHILLFVFAVKDTTILNATVLVNTAPIFSVVLSTFLFKLKPSRLAILGIAISITGASIIAYAEAGVLNAGAAAVYPTIKGDFEALLAAFVEALYLNYGKKIRGEGAILPTIIPIYIFAAVVIGVLSLLSSRPLTFPAEADLILLLLGLGVLPTAVAHTLYFSSLSSLRSFETATMALLEPVGATFLGIILFNEAPQPIFALGTSFILLGIVFVALRKS
jgi:drug/metabolite transporter (DMT)-like permease